MSRVLQERENFDAAGLKPTHQLCFVAKCRIQGLHGSFDNPIFICVVVKIMVPFWIPIITRHLIFVPKKGP